MIGNRYLMMKTKETSYFRKSRVVRLPFAMALGGLITYGFNMAFFRPIYLQELEDFKLYERYFFLDLNADLMREDLEQMGISVAAKHFNME